MVAKDEIITDKLNSALAEIKLVLAVKNKNLFEELFHRVIPKTDLHQKYYRTTAKITSFPVFSSIKSLLLSAGIHFKGFFDCTNLF